MTWKELKELADEKALFMEREPDSFMYQVYKAERQWLLILMSITDDFETDNGKIINSKKNIITISKIDQAYQQYQAAVIYPLIVDLITRLNNTVDKTNEYYKTMLQFSHDLKAAGASLNTFKTALNAGEMDIKIFIPTESSIFSVINARLGINAAGNLVKGGYLYNIYNNTSLVDYSRELLYKGVVTEMPISDFRAAATEDMVGLRETIPGEDDKVIKNGQLAKQYSLISSEIFAKVNRTAATIIQQDHELKYFIYGGTIIKTTRPFCRKKCNLIFNTEEAKAWPDETPGPIYIDKDTYDAIVDMGGINCRHTPLFISSELYQILKGEGSDLIPA